MWYEIYKWYDSYIPYFNLYFTNINYIIYMRNFAGNATANRSQVSALSQSVTVRVKLQLSLSCASATAHALMDRLFEHECLAHVSRLSYVKLSLNYHMTYHPTVRGSRPLM